MSVFCQNLYPKWLAGWGNGTSSHPQPGVYPHTLQEVPHGATLSVTNHSDVTE